VDYLNRAVSGISDEIWQRIDQTAVEAARDLLTARRFLPVEGPYGLGLTSIEVGDDGYCREPGPDEAGAVISRAISIPMLRRSFRLSIRRIEGHRQLGQPLSLTAAADAAEAMARREEEFIYYGREDFHLPGLLSVDGRAVHRIGDWANTQQVLDDVLAAVNTLDGNGFPGPYALALAAPLYNALFHRYEDTDMLQLEHLRRLCELGVYKTAIKGGVLVDARVGRIIIGQDMMAGYARQDGIHHELYLSESLVLLIEAPGAVCALEGDE
jgi:uncharacterized linocin/CFP29 family protein